MPYTQAEVQNLSSQTFAYILVREEGHTLTIRLNRPEKKNAMSPTMVREYAYAMSYAHHSPHIWAVVFEAEGSVWCAGADLKAMRGQEEPNNSSIPASEGDQPILMGELFWHIHKPVIAKVHAPVFAGGFLLICGATYVVASPEARFSLPEVKRGIFPFQVLASLLQVMPARRALDLCLRAATLSAEEAERYGLVTHLCPADQLDTQVAGLLEELSQNSPSAIRLGLKAYDQMRSLGQEQLHGYLAQMLQETIQTADAQEGLAAFAEKRPPQWKGY
nr:enoyl-CoA hydratase-related protein [Eisenibacter elegans]